MSYKTVIRLSDEEGARLKATALVIDRSINWVVRRAVTEYLDRLDPAQACAISGRADSGVPSSLEPSTRRVAQAASATAD